MFELTVSVEFEAAHRIVDYPGKCNRLHGHNWVIEVSVIGDKLNELGMLVDFKELKSEVNKIINQLDHFYLNDLAAFQTKNPTAENIARYIYEELSEQICCKAEIKVKAVKVWETPKSAVCYSKGE